LKRKRKEKNKEEGQRKDKDNKTAEENMIRHDKDIRTGGVEVCEKRKNKSERE